MPGDLISHEDLQKVTSEVHKFQGPRVMASIAKPDDAQYSFVEVMANNGDRKAVEQPW